MLRLSAFLFVALLAPPVSAQSAQSADSSAQELTPVGGRLVAAVHAVPPYAIKNADGTWDGIAVELWREIGRREGFEAALREVPADGLVEAVTSGAADIALTSRATAAEEARVDFVLPYLIATLGITETRGARLWTVVKRLFSPTFLKVVLGLAVLLLLVGLVAWRIERSDNEDDFGQGFSGVWDGFYWAGVTMSTIGYGDKTPRTKGGQALALVWMLVSMAVTAALTAAIVSALGTQATSGTSLPEAVRGKQVGVVEGSAAQAYLDMQRVTIRAFPTVAAGLDAVEGDSLDVFVDTVPVLKSAVSESGLNSLKVTATSAEPEQWAFAVPVGSALRERLSRAVLDRTSDPAWQAMLERYGS